MGYGREIYGAALDELSRRRGLVRQQQAQRRQEIAQKIPEVLEIERRLAQTSLEAARSVLGATGDIQQQMDRLTAHNKQLQQRYNTLLLQHGYPIDYLDLHPVCPICEDEGFTDDGQCQCLKELMRKEAYRRINSLTPIASCDFDHFSLDTTILPRWNTAVFRPASRWKPSWTIVSITPIRFPFIPPAS